MPIVPIWKKLSLSTSEAAAYTNINLSVIQALVNLAKMGRIDFPYFYVGKNAKIPRVALEKWIDRLTVSHPKLSLTKLQDDIAVAVEAEKKLGRPRKKRA